MELDSREGQCTFEGKHKVHPYINFRVGDPRDCPKPLLRPQRNRWDS